MLSVWINMDFFYTFNFFFFFLHHMIRCCLKISVIILILAFFYVKVEVKMWLFGL